MANVSFEIFLFKKPSYVSYLVLVGDNLVPRAFHHREKSGEKPWERRKMLGWLQMLY